MPALSAYVHIPFCAYKCDFCDFTAFSGLDHLAEPYCRVVCQEIADRLSPLPSRLLIESIYFGGGTPGLIDPRQITAILATLATHADLESGLETTLETTPHAITAAKAELWLAAGITRLSIGVQSFNDDELQAAGRDHSADDARKGIKMARQAGFTNVSIDLMYGLPKQTLASWQATISEALAFELPHLSAYGLQLSTNSPLSLRYPKDSPSYPSEETFTEQYLSLVKQTAEAGLLQYEISNFCRPGFESRHNLSYWSNEEYLAFGVGAHRYFAGKRSSNWRSLAKYMNDWLFCETNETIDPDTRVKEAIFLSLRTRKGIDLNDFRARWGIDLEQKLAAPIEKLLAGGMLELTDGRLVLSQKGVLLSNLVLAELI